MKNLLIIVTIAFGQMTLACRMPKAFNVELKEKADVVFIGSMKEYAVTEKITDNHAEITFKVIKTLKGPNKKEWTAFLASNTNFEVPPNDKLFNKCFSKEFEVGLILQKKGQPMPKVVIGNCDPPYILPSKGKAPVICFGS